MIIVRLSGGLGNQMFQYAMGRALAIRRNTELKLDISFYAAPPPGEALRTFALPHFRIAGAVASPEDYRVLGIPDIRDRSGLARTWRAAIRLRERFLPITKRRFIVESGFAFCDELLSAGPDCLLAGIWQSPRYFDDATGTIRSDFAPKAPLSVAAQELLRDIESCESVSLHVRRGDYVADAKTSSKHGACSPEYYAAAIEYIESKVPNMRLFVFSDDIAWAREHLPVPPGTVFISRPELPDYEELALMSACAHHITAHSSYSWWGAWLGKNEKKIIVAPKHWFANGLSTADLLPSSWLQL